MDSIAFLTFEDLIMFDEVEFVRLEDFDLSKSLYRDLVMEKQPESDQTESQMECFSEEKPRGEEVVIPAPLKEASLLLNTEGGHIVEISTSDGKFEDMETSKKINGELEDITIPYEVKVSKTPSRFPEENLKKGFEAEIPPSKEKPFLCEVCGKNYSNERSLRNHSFIHTGVHPYTCQTCHRTFRFHSRLKDHQRREPYCRRAISSR